MVLFLSSPILSLPVLADEPEVFYTLSADGREAYYAKDGYIDGFYNVVANNKEGMTFSLSPVLDDNEYRVVLTWGDIPNDLDSHLFYYNEYDQELFHVYWASAIGYYNGEIVASLDVDDTSSYGPETVTITFDASMVENGGEIRYCVHKITQEEV